ncbi:hypothetical protein BsWGS_06585 [Bradybaena similaris]
MFKRENLRKNFLRVKQNIDQNLGRAEQSKVLTEDQEENEKRVETVKHAFQNITKKAATVLQTTGTTDFDKKLKKLPETALSHAILESAQSLGTDTLLGSVCQLSGDCQMNLARELVQYEETVEQEFITPLQTVVDVDIPSIVKWRKALTKAILDMDSAKNRLNQIVRQSQVPGANMTSAAAKADVIKDEYEEATQKVENIKDNLSIELCNFASKESEQSSRLLIFLEAQASYHRKALEIIEDCIPQLALAIKNSSAKPCYGMPLEEHLRLMCRDVALVLEACVLTLLETGMEEEGLFRLAGSSVKLKKLKACFDAHSVDMEEFSTDPHTVAGALKQYLRELPEPLLTFQLYDDFIQAAMLPQDQRLQALWTVIHQLPKPNYNNFRYLIKFLAKLAEKCDINKMKPSNIGIVIGPNLIWSERNDAPNMMSTGAVSGIIETVVTHADWFFPGEVDFSVGLYGDDGQEAGQVQYDKPDHTETGHTQTNTTLQVAPSTVRPSSPSLSSAHQESVDTASSHQKRAVRKPAPAPPPAQEKMGASVKSGHQEGSANICDDADTTNMPHSQAAPTIVSVALPESPTAGSSEKDRQKLTGGHVERPAVPPPSRPENAQSDRPRLPSTLNPPVPARGHQRSSSTGALINKSLGSLDSSSVTGVPNAGSLSSFINQGDQDVKGPIGSVSQNYAANSLAGVPSVSSDNIACHFIVYPRPSSPLPPSPVHSEYTKL